MLQPGQFSYKAWPHPAQKRESEGFSVEQAPQATLLEFVVLIDSESTVMGDEVSPGTFVVSQSGKESAECDLLVQLDNCTVNRKPVGKAFVIWISDFDVTTL